MTVTSASTKSIKSRSGCSMTEKTEMENVCGAISSNVGVQARRMAFGSWKIRKSHFDRGTWSKMMEKNREEGYISCRDLHQ